MQGWEPQSIREESENLEIEGTWRSSYPIADEETKGQEGCHLTAQCFKISEEMDLDSELILAQGSLQEGLDKEINGVIKYPLFPSY